MTKGVGKDLDLRDPPGPRRAQQDDRGGATEQAEAAPMGPPIEGMTQVLPGLYEANEDYSVFTKRPA
jgi:hypothetical protein